MFLKKCAVSLQWIWLRISLVDGANETSSEKGSEVAVVVALASSAAVAAL